MLSWVGDDPGIVPARVYALAITSDGRILLVVTKTLMVRPEHFLEHLYWAEDPAAAHLLRLATELDRRR